MRVNEVGKSPQIKVNTTVRSLTQVALHGAGAVSRIFWAGYLGGNSPGLVGKQAAH